MRLLSLLFLLPMPVAAQSFTILESPITQNNGRFGQFVTFGDVTGDGLAEPVVATRQSEPADQNADGAGRVYVLEGDGNVRLILDPPAPEPDGSFGQAVAVAGDADGDGLNDVFVCAPNEDPGGLDRSGQLHVFSGATGALIRSQSSPNPEEQGFFCTSAVAVGDLDGDGQADLLVGAASEDGGVSNAGRTYAFASATGAVLHTLASPHAFATSYFGGTLADAGDFDGDGVPDLLVSAQSEPFDGFGGAGRVYLFSGADATLLNTYDPLDPDGEAAFGVGLASAGDLTGDGIPDLFVAAAIRSGDTGKVHALSGADGALLYTITSPSSQENDAFASGFGNGIAAVPDSDADGYTDLLVGAINDAEFGTDAGRVYLFSGADGALLDAFVSPHAGFISRFGASLAAADATGDGLPELLIGAPTEPAGIFGGGRAYLISNGTGTAADAMPEGAAAAFRVAPNPARHATTIRFELPAPASVHLAVYDALGRRIAVLADGMLADGLHIVPFDAAGLPSGLYFVRMNTGVLTHTQRFVLVR